MNGKLEDLIKTCSNMGLDCSHCQCTEKECLYSLLAIMTETDYDSIEEYMSHYLDKQ
jgi:hypothetical protein